MINNEVVGLNQYDWKHFTDILVKCNDEQLIMLATMVLSEHDRRLLRGIQ
jgi:hypothetical protein